MKLYTVIIIIASFLVLCGVCRTLANDPNVQPAGFSGPPPNTEYLVKVNKSTVRGTYSVDYSKSDLERKLAAIDRRLNELQLRKADVEKKLAVLER